MSIVDLYINDQKYNLVNFEQAADYFGELDDVAIFEFKEKTPNFEFLDGDDYTNTPINLFISGIELINETQNLYQNETQNLYQNETQIYKVLLTRAIIFHLENGRELMFEKDDCFFSEQIIIKTGTNLKDKLDANFEFEKDWNEDEYKAVCEHNIISIN